MSATSSERVQMRAAPSLTAEQEEPVARRGEPLLLAAGAGSGKTAVLVERFLRAVREDGLAPAQVLAITFTDRAAGELRARIRARLLELGDRAAARDIEGAFIGTFHAFCARLVRAHTRTLALDPDFAILDEGLAARVRTQAFDEALRGLLAGERPAAVALIAAYEPAPARAMIESAYLALRSRGSRMPRLPDAGARVRADHAEDTDAAAAVALLDELLVRFGERYELAKRARRALDFDDLELIAAELLERPAVRAAWAERFAMLMVDEFQDTNPRQLAILNALDRRNLFTVGDEFQSIYGFRHADVTLFRDRRSALQSHGGVLELTHNFRSVAPLLAVVRNVFARRFEHFAPLRAARGEPDPPAAGGGQLRLLGEEEPAVELLLTDTRGWEERADLADALARAMPRAAPWRQAEAHALAERVSALIAGGSARAGEIAVLLRAAGDLGVYERALALRGVSTLPMVGGFWSQQQVVDVLCYLGALANPLDEVALFGALASPIAGCTPDTLALLASAARARSRSVWATACDPDTDGGQPLQLQGDQREALARFCALLERERAAAATLPIWRLVDRVLGASGYREHVLSLDRGPHRLANVHKLMRIASAFEASEGRDLRALLDHVSFLRETAAGTEPEAPIGGAQPDAVRLMTVHAAKGLEFPVVCVADLGRAPSARAASLLCDGERVGLRLARLDGEKPVPTLDYDELCAERAEAEGQEEDRILYVATTRARDMLLLSGAADLARWPDPRPGAPPIAWLVPALSPELPSLAAARGGATLDIDVAGASVRCRFTSPGHPPALPASSGAHADTAPDAGGEPVGAGAAPVGAPSGGADAGPLRSGAAPGPAADAAARAAESAGAGAIAPGEISALSYTSLGALERCGYRYYLERVLRLAEDRSDPALADGARGERLDARSRGTLAHRVLERHDFARGGAPDAEAIEAAASELGLCPDADEREGLATMLAGALRAEPAARVAGAARVQREQPFSFALAPELPLISGVIDVLAHERHGAVMVLDYKTDRVGAEDDLAHLVERDYGLQRMLYALACLRAGASSVEVVHWYLERPEDAVRARYGADERERLQALAAARVRTALDGGFAVSAAPNRALCAGCPGRRSLCSWSEAQTLREAPAG